MQNSCSSFEQCFLFRFFPNGCETNANTIEWTSPIDQRLAWCARGIYLKYSFWKAPAKQKLMAMRKTNHYSNIIINICPIESWTKLNTLVFSFFRFLLSIRSVIFFFLFFSYLLISKMTRQKKNFRCEICRIICKLKTSGSTDWFSRVEREKKMIFFTYERFCTK